MNIRSFALALLAVAVFSGCKLNLVPTSGQASGQASASLLLKPKISEGSYGTQAVVPNYAKANIYHLVVKLFRAEVQVATKDVPNVVLNTAVTFTDLAGNSTYQARCYAYNAAGTAPANLISLDDSNSYTDVTTANDDRPVLANIKVKLIDLPFAAQGTTSIAVTGGSYVAIASPSYAPQFGGLIATFAGNGIANSSGDGGAATSASMYTPVGLTFDSAGNLYIAEYSNHRIRKVTTATGIINTVAGNGIANFSGDGGAATSASIYFPYGVAFDNSGNLYIADLGNNRIRKVTTDGIISTIAGNGTAGFSGDGGAATSAAISVIGVACDNAGNVYIVDHGNSRVRKITIATGIISTVLGTGTAGFSGDGSAATSAQIRNPRGVAFDSAGNLYLVDQGNHRIRKVTTATGIINTVAGTGATGSVGDGGAATSATMDTPLGIAFDRADNFYFSDRYNYRIRKVTIATGIINTVAGNGTASYSGDGGAATGAAMNFPYGLACDSSDNVYFSDYFNNRVRILF